MSERLPSSELNARPASVPARSNGNGATVAGPLIEADAYLFDIDGTLLNTRDGVQYRAFSHAVRAVFGLEPRMEGIVVHGNTDVGILRALLRREGIPEPEVYSGLPRLIEHMCAEVSANASAMRVEVCPSIRELLERLREADKLLGIVSGNLEPIGWVKLQAAGLRHFFSFGCFSNPLELRRDIFRQGVREARNRLHQNASVCAVGDTPSDIDAARALGIPIIAVATGIFPHHDLASLNPDTCVRCCTELLEIA